MSGRTSEFVVVALALTLPLAACSDSMGPGLDSGEVRVVLARSDGSTSSAALANVVSASLGAPIQLESVESIDVTVTAVQALPLGETEGDSGPWVTLELTSAETLNLLDLPLAADGGLELAQGELEAGTYGNLRLMFSDATITFNEDVTFGGGAAAQTYEAGTAYPLYVPSGAQTGVKIPALGFTVEDGDGTTVVISFDAAGSVQTVEAAAVGVLMSPVLTAQAD